MGETASIAPLVELIRVGKQFGPVVALEDISFAARAGEVHALLGDNGAGKSTLIKILSGVHRPSSGEMRIGGEPITLASPRQALDKGIATVFQDLAMIPLMSITRNFFLGREPEFGRFITRRIDMRRADEIVSRNSRGSASPSAIRSRPSARCPAASGNAWRSPARSITVPAC